MLKRIDKVFDLESTVSLLKKLTHPKYYKITSPIFPEDRQILIEKKEREFGYTFGNEADGFDVKDWPCEEVILEGEDITLVTSPRHFDFKKRMLGKSTGEIRDLRTSTFRKEEPLYHRLVIPVQNKLNFLFSIESVSLIYSYLERISTINASQIVIDENTFILFEITDKVFGPLERYLVIDCDKQTCFEIFNKYCYSILIGFGFTTGLFVQNEGFFFQYADSHKQIPLDLYYSSFRKSVKCHFIPVYSNPYGYIHDHSIAARYRDKTKVIALDELSTLCTKIHKDDDFKYAVLLFLEANVQSLVSSPGLLSIALEALARIVCQENEDSVLPIGNKLVAKKIRASLISTLLEYKDQIGAQAMDIIRAKIDQINQPTNREKLLIPFRLLEIPINDDDKQAIEQRNKFLHGDVPMLKNKKPDNIKEADEFRYYLFLKLHFLVSSIILKYVGYDGLIVNFTKIYSSSTGTELNEEYYRPLKMNTALDL